MSVFVSREQELAELNTYFDKMLAGKGQICFITGEPGHGKTTLALEFVRRAQRICSNLGTATGLCDPQTGQGDPYLPFRTMLQILTDTHSASQTGNKGKLVHQGLVDISIDVLLDWGPALVGTFVPGAALVAKLGSSVGRAARRGGVLSNWARNDQSDAVMTSQLDQNQVFQQYVNVLTKLSDHLPLLLILDDAQWADSSSIDLLFYMVRRIQESRIFLVVTYRRTELELWHRGERHPLIKAVVEAKRYLGNVTIDLDKSQGREFVDAFLDSEPNQLSEEFRETLFRHTGGHALFVVELLRSMQERGHLERDHAGVWQQCSSLDWKELPDRAEAVIEERIHRLPSDLRQILQSASVQGESFSGEILAHARGTDARELVRRLNSELVQRHRLLIDHGRERVGMLRLSRFAFQNQLFQQYLYDSLNGTERTYMHEDTAKALESLYADQVDTVAVTLAWHYEKAGLLKQARYYLHLAGKTAAASASYDLAVDYFSLGLSMTSEAEAELRFDLLMAREEAYYHTGDREAQQVDLDSLKALSAHLADAQRQSDAALRQTRYAIEISGEYGSGVALAKHALLAAERAGNEERQASSWRWLGEALWRQGEFTSAKEHLIRALDLARHIGARQVEALTLHHLGIVGFFCGEGQAGVSYFQDALTIYRSIGDRLGETRNLNSLGYAMSTRGSYEPALASLNEGLQLAQRAGLLEVEIRVLGSLAYVVLQLGNYVQAEEYATRQLKLSRELELRRLEAEALMTLGRVGLATERCESGLEKLNTALNILQIMGDWEREPIALLSIGDGLRQLGRTDDALQIYLDTLDRANAHDDTGVRIFALAGLTMVDLDLASSVTAGEHALALLVLLPETEVRHDLAAFAILYMAGYRGLAIVDDDRALAVLQAGYWILKETAGKIESEELRCSFLENVSANRILLETCEEIFPEGVPDTQVDLSALFPSSVDETGSDKSGQIGQMVTNAYSATKVDYEGIDHEGVDLDLVSSPDRVENSASVDRVDLSGAGLVGVQLNAKDLAGWCLAGADLRQAQLRAANLRNAELRGTDLRDADLRGADLRGANLSGANLQGADITEIIADKRTTWPQDLDSRTSIT